MRDEVEEENQQLLRRWNNFRKAAEYVAAAFSEVPGVEKVALFGSAALPLFKERSRYPDLRWSGAVFWHECKDVDLAVWVSDLGCLKAMQRARGKAVGRLVKDLDIGVAHHQVDVFVIEPGTDRYLGRLCTYYDCPKGKPACLAVGCGKTLYLQQHDDFIFEVNALGPDRSTVLFKR